jgi:phenylalanyl-tRNA synthetase alpha chain
MPQKVSPKIKSMHKKIEKMQQGVNAALEETKTFEELDNIRTQYLGRNGLLTRLLKVVPQVPLKHRPEAGRLANTLKRTLEQILREKNDLLRKEKEERELKIDISMPGISPELGSVHPISQTMQRISQIFMNLGFKVVEGPEVETDYYNFTALNIPEGPRDAEGKTPFKDYCPWPGISS